MVNGRRRGAMNLIGKTYHKLFSAIDDLPISLFRVFFGLFVVIQFFGIYTPDYIDGHYIQPKIFFPFELFDILHLPVLPESLMYLLFLFVGISGICIAVGIFYKAALLVFLTGFGYIFLLETSYFNNHYYLMLLLGFLLLFTNDRQSLSFDKIFRPGKNTAAQYWQLFLLRAQISVVYFYAGVAKIYPDWLNGTILQDMIQGRRPIEKLEALPLFSEIIHNPSFQHFITYGSMLFDLTIWIFLWSRKTRPAALVLCILFHLLNQYLFTIGIFHLFMISALILFVDGRSLQKSLKKIDMVLQEIFLRICSIQDRKT